MPQFVFDIRASGPGFEVHLLDEHGAPLTDAAGNPLVRPISTLDPAHEPLFTRIVARAPVDDDMLTFGRLLFSTLIGPEWWARIYAATGFIDLTIVCDRVPSLARLPWEMMVAPDDRFLAQIPQLGIVRRVSGSAATFTPLPAPPTVLVAVGAELHRDVIRPAAECFALLNNLKDARRGLHLRTHLLLRATPERIRTAVRTFRPQVVHLICHGLVDANSRRGSLVLASDQSSAATVNAFSETLLDILECDGVLPSIVVLSACYTAAASYADVGQVAMPLAQELGARIPLVVGMSGAITDQACRLFARRFYESLLSDGDVAQASSEGRRAALSQSGTDPRTTVDWTMPVVCVAEQVGAAKVPVQPPSAETLEWEQLAGDFATRPDIVFCDRVELMNLYDVLMAPAEAQRAMRPERTDLQAVTILADEDSPDRRYGRTRVIRELSAKAARDGHVPVVIETLGGAWPKTRQALLAAIVKACRLTADRFAIGSGVCRQLTALLAAGNQPIPAGVDPAIQARFQGETRTADDVDVLAFALRLDLVALLGAVRQSRPAAERDQMRVLLLVDDVHKMDAAAIDLASGLLEAGGLRGARHEVRVALTYATVLGNPGPGEAPALEAIKSLNDRTWVATTTLGPFRQPDEDRHAYERFLLHWPGEGYVGLALRPDATEFVSSFWEIAAQDIGGIPSLLRSEGPRLVKMFLRLPPKGQILRSANDDDLLRQATQSTR